MSKQKQYKPLSKNELAVYKKNKQLIEVRREQFTNALTTAINRIRESKTKDSEKLSVKIKYFNRYLHKKKQTDIMKVVNYWLDELSD